MQGQRVCRLHGGLAPQNLNAARERLAKLVHPAISRVADLIDHGDSDATRFAAARYVLEVAGYKAAVQVVADNQVSIVVRYEDRGLVSAPEPPGTRHSTPHALNGSA